MKGDILEDKLLSRTRNGKRLQKAKCSLSPEQKIDALEATGTFSEIELIARFAGIDKVYVEIPLDQNSVYRQVKSKTGRWKEMTYDKSKAKSKKGLSSIHDFFECHVRDEQGNQLFYLKIYNSLRPHPETGKGIRAWVLLIQMNPSNYMHSTGVKGAMRGQNYVAGSAMALEHLIGDLKALLGSGDLKLLRTLNIRRLDIPSLKLIQVHLTRDFRFHAWNLKFRKKLGWNNCRAAWEHDLAIETLALFLNSHPSFTERYDESKSCENTFIEGQLKKWRGKKAKTPEDRAIKRELKKLSKFMVKGQNPLLSPYTYLSRGNKQHRSVIYVKECFNRNKQLSSAFPRFEMRLLKHEAVRTALGISDLFGLHELLLDVERWHAEGRIGEVPLLEAFLNKWLQKWHKPTAKTLARENSNFFPPLTTSFINFMLAIEKASYESQIKAGCSPTPDEHVSHLAAIANKFRAGETPEFEEQEGIVFSLNMSLLWLKTHTFHKIAGQVTGYLDVKGKPVGGSDANTGYDNLMSLVRFYLDSYGGDFLGYSKSDQRQVLLERLTVHSAGQVHL